MLRNTVSVNRAPNPPIVNEFELRLPLKALMEFQQFVQHRFLQFCNFLNTYLLHLLTGRL